jgi:hypothetical protein
VGLLLCTSTKCAIKSGIANLMAGAKMPLTLVNPNLMTKHCMQDERGKALIEASKVHWVVWPR